AAALRGAVLIQGGGILGGLLIARLVDRGLTIPGMVTAYLIVAAAFAAFLVVPAEVFLWSALLCIVGAGVSGTQGALTALSAIFYPPGIRATGAGWASACGRAGAVLGPLAGGLVLGRLDLAPAAHLALLIPPILLCAACVAALRYAWRPAADSAAQSSPS
ncbi:MAG TPA: MFS transporter, partial [Gammaproteobacteria bacterium]|nr:MFS transporter [Gammaproteobacteria bacterium]